MRKYKQNEIEELANILKNDGVISVPTDTVYGICARINSSKAYNKLVDIKKRPPTKPFPVMCADEKQIEKIAIVDEKAKKIIHAFMPGPITLILNKKEDINNGDALKVAIRIAPIKALKELIIKLGSPIFMTSANISGAPTCRTLDEIEQVCPMLDGIMEGEVSFGIASTIIDCTEENVKIKRQGPISIEQIIKVIKG